MNTIQWYNDPIKTANIAKDGTGTVAEVLKADADLYVDRLVFRAIGSNVATVARVFANNGNDNATANNNSLIAELALPSTTLDEAAAFTEQKLDLDLWLPKGYRLTVTLGTTVASGYQVTAICGRYQDLQSFQGRGF